MKKLYRGPYIDAFYHVWFHLAQLFQRSRLKYEKGNGQTTDTKWGQYLTWPFGSGQLKTIIWPWDQRSRSHKGHYGTRHTTIWSCTHIPIIIDLSRKKKMLWPRQENIIQKNNYLTLRSKVKVPRRSLRYATHRLMVMHPHAKYHWPISKDKKVMVRTSFTEKKQKKKSD
jgi:hypothetical protein